MNNQVEIQKIRTPREKSEAVERTIYEIRKSNKITNDLISKICKKNDINENHIRLVGGWKGKNSLLD
jgi:hypothetical protein